MKKNQTPPEQKLFGLSVTRVPGGYQARAEIATTEPGTFIVLSSTAMKENHVAGVTEPPREAALQEVLDKSTRMTADPQFGPLIPANVRNAVLATKLVRELSDLAQNGDRSARVGLRRMAHGDNYTLRKAVRMQRLFGRSM